MKARRVVDEGVVVELVDVLEDAASVGAVGAREGVGRQGFSRFCLRLQREHVSGRRVDVDIAGHCAEGHRSGRSFYDVYRGEE